MVWSMFMTSLTACWGSVLWNQLFSNLQAHFINREFMGLFFFFFLFFLLPQHAEVPWPGIEPAPQQWPEPQQWQHQTPIPLNHQGTPENACLYLKSGSYFHLEWFSQVNSIVKGPSFKYSWGLVCKICVRGHSKFQNPLGPKQMPAHGQEFLISSLGWFPFLWNDPSGTKTPALRMNICECRLKEEKEAQWCKRIRTDWVDGQEVRGLALLHSWDSAIGQVSWPQFPHLSIEKTGNNDRLGPFYL